MTGTGSGFERIFAPRAFEQAFFQTEAPRKNDAKR
jgi:hypothetical protein